MILTCPNCSTRFLTDPNALGPDGRVVRCGACAYSWFQEPLMAEEPAYEPAPLNLDDVITTPLDRDDDARDKRRLWPRLLAWFLFLFLVAAILAGAYRYRGQIVGYWPPATKIYQVLGIPVKPPVGYGLKVPKESIRFERGATDGVPQLKISGRIINGSKQEQKVGRMRFTLSDKDGKELRSWVWTPPPKTLKAGASMDFETSINHPPAAAQTVRIKFILGE